MIELWDGYIITADDYNIILCKPEPRADRKVSRMSEATFHPTLARALLAFHRVQLRKCIRRNDLTLRQALAKAGQLEQRILEAIREPNFEGEV